MRVHRRRLSVPPADEREFATRNIVVVHPQVFEDVVVQSAPPLPRGTNPERWHGLYSHHAPLLTDGAAMTARWSVRVCGLSMDTDPCLRLDEVVLRREERL